tara:strand:- start:2811 stop:3347 length:537 start_codon:yes stop_codon:yes gene_type:complete
MITPIHAIELPAFHEVEDGEVTCIPADERDVFVASELLKTKCNLSSLPSAQRDTLGGGWELIPYTGTGAEHCLTDGEVVYYQVEAEIPPPRKRIGGPETKRYPVWVRGTYEGGGYVSRWEPPEPPEPVNPDDDCGCFRSLLDAVHYSILQRVDRELYESARCSMEEWDAKHPPQLEGY